MDERENRGRCGYLEKSSEKCHEEVDYYRKLIFELSNRIKDEKFLRRIYISLRDFIIEEAG